MKAFSYILLIFLQGLSSLLDPIGTAKVSYRIPNIHLYQSKHQRPQYNLFLVKEIENVLTFLSIAFNFLQSNNNPSPQSWSIHQIMERAQPQRTKKGNLVRCALWNWAVVPLTDWARSIVSDQTFPDSTLEFLSSSMQSKMTSQKQAHMYFP